MTELEKWKHARQLCRTNLYYLCRVLGYNDVNQEVHGNLISHLQQFKGGTDEFTEKQIPGLKDGQFAIPPVDVLRASYKPHVPDFWDLEGPRRPADFIFRGSLKTTVKTFAYPIQWELNYPDVRILLFVHTDPKGREFLSEIKKHYTTGETFRYLFPEHVPWGGEIEHFGNQEFFDSKARKVWRKEHTFSFLTIDSAKSGGHWDLIIADDVEDSTNVLTKERIETVKREFGLVGPLLETHAHPTKGEMSGWFGLTGTFYDFAGLNYTVAETELAKPTEQRIWDVNVQSAVTNGLDYKDPDATFLWPTRVGRKKLAEIENDPAQGPGVLASQYLMNPIPPGSGLIESQDEIIWTPRRVMNELYARLSLYAAVDLAGMDTARGKSSDNDYSVITLGGFGTDGHLYVLECIHGRPSPEKVIEELFALARRHPRLTQIKVEKEAHARVLLKFLRAEEAKKGVWLPIMELQRDNQQSKQQKIRGLQPWFKRGMIHFADDLPCKTAIINEIMRFPKFNHDDILDTLCDLMSSRSGGVQAEVMGNAQKDFSVEQEDPFQEFMRTVYDNPDKEQFASEAICGW